MNVLLGQGTWGDNDRWWRRAAPGEAPTFADAVVAAGHTLVNGRYFEWSTGLGGTNPFSDSDLRVWRGAGRHMFDYCVPPRCWHAVPSDDFCLVLHSHCRQVGKYAFKLGLKAATVIFVSGPIRSDVDKETAGWRANVGRVVTLNGGKDDRWQILGEFGDRHFGWRRKDPEAEGDPRWSHTSFPDADHSSLLNNPAQFARVISEIHR